MAFLVVAEGIKNVSTTKESKVWKKSNIGLLFDNPINIYAIFSPRPISLTITPIPKTPNKNSVIGFEKPIKTLATLVLSANNPKIVIANKPVRNAGIISVIHKDIARSKTTNVILAFRAKSKSNKLKPMKTTKNTLVNTTNDNFIEFELIATPS